ncbi:rhamnogalacturonan acetylesterase [Enterococcus aquimarinus]|uniref:Rhamnogalacturonan acetylesterase n=1 Tax=Enterococcus aquimarinus TaxID=328396 RepID=A0A1L8QTJ3_9ENTE|nr:rhamnogalacturonan acetylesterase [Enterococcus aquimarinus]OJG10817.1 rhamnogalacturonan acetylesterase [Enterococcus aquimarinus]
MPTIFIAGDSTAATKAENRRPETGWGEKLATYFDQNLQIENHAMNGRSSKSFIHEQRLETIKNRLAPGDYLFIQFGHNDQKIDESRGTLPYGSYLTYLTQYIEASKEKVACPVLLTPISRRDYLPDGSLNPLTLGEYPQAMKQLAQMHDVIVLDIFAKTQEWLKTYSPEETTKFFLHGKPNEFACYPEGVCDNTHLSDLGAETIAAIIAQAVQESQLPLKHYLRDSSIKNYKEDFNVDNY